MVVCKGCGAFMKFDIANQLLKCDYCNSFAAPEAVDDGRESGSTDIPDDEEEVTLYTCPQCGGDIMCDDDTAATFCSYCGASSVVLAKRMERIRKPSCIIPFKKTKEECEALYRKNVDRAIFAPAYMKNNTVVDRFRGIYMPYWVYTIKHSGPLAMKGKKSFRRGDYVYTQTYAVNTSIDASVGNLSYDASASFSDVLSRAAGPYSSGDAC